MRVLLALHRVGPYHHGRFEAACRSLELHVLETRPQSLEYPWLFKPEGDYQLHQLIGQPTCESDPPRKALDQQLQALLGDLQPAVVVSVGWADRAYQRLLLACHRRRIPLVIVSDSRQRDEPRSAAKEWIKRQLLRGYSAALVAGRESRAYLLHLGFPPEAVAQPWDVVDNALFQAAGAAAQPLPSAAADTRPHFLCVSRFAAKKNHAGLLAAYATYQRQGGSWGLRLIGAGPLEPTIRHRIAQLPEAQRVRLLPFQQLPALASSYAQASAFVLASTSDQWGLVVNEAMAAGLPCLVSSACGCAADLIEHGTSGWCFDPSNPAALSALMHTAERQQPGARAAMVAAARRRLQTFSNEAFAGGLQQAVRQALARPRFSLRAALTAQLLSRQP